MTYSLAQTVWEALSEQPSISLCPQIMSGATGIISLIAQHQSPRLSREDIQCMPHCKAIHCLRYISTLYKTAVLGLPLKGFCMSLKADASPQGIRMQQHCYCHVARCLQDCLMTVWVPLFLLQGGTVMWDARGDHYNQAALELPKHQVDAIRCNLICESLVHCRF